MIFRELSKMPFYKGQLKKLVKGEYHSIRYKLTEYQDDTTKIECRVYIHGYGGVTAPTWDDALQAMRKQIEEKGK